MSTPADATQHFSEAANTTYEVYMILSNLTWGGSLAHRPPPGIWPQVTEQLSAAEGAGRLFRLQAATGRGVARTDAVVCLELFARAQAGRVEVKQFKPSNGRTPSENTAGLRNESRLLGWGPALRLWLTWDQGVCVYVCVHARVCVWQGGREWGLLAAFKDSYTTDRKTGGINWSCHIAIEVKRLRQNRRACVCVCVKGRERVRR